MGRLISKFGVGGGGRWRFWLKCVFLVWYTVFCLTSPPENFESGKNIVLDPLLLRYFVGPKIHPGCSIKCDS